MSHKLCRVIQVEFIIEDYLTEEELDEGKEAGYYIAIGSIDLFEVQISFYTSYNDDLTNCTEVEMRNGTTYVLNVDSKEFSKLHIQAKNMKDLLNIN
jgi:hypothetical protein